MTAQVWRCERCDIKADCGIPAIGVVCKCGRPMALIQGEPRQTTKGRR